MKTFRLSVGWNWMGALGCLALGGVAWGQTSSAAPSSSSSPASSAALQAYQQEQRALGQEEQALVSQGATPEQMQAWHEQNAARFTAQQQRAQQMAAASALQPMPLIPAANIPANASSTLKDFLTTQAALANARAQIHNQLVQALPANATGAQIGQMQQQEEQLFQQQHAADLQLQTQRAQTLANESASQPLPIPPPLSIPANASPQLAAFLTTRDQIMRNQISLQNQYQSATPAARQAALQQWHEQNAALFQQMQQQAQALSQTHPTTQN